VASLGAKVPLRGFSSFAFVPGTGDRHLVALKTVETAELVESYFGVYDIEGNVLMPEIKLPWEGVKFEGVTFLGHSVQP